MESFYGGSHKNFLDGLVKYSRHQIEPITLPARFWKWRLRASALYFAEQYAKSVKKYDLLIATDMLNLAEFKALSNYDRPMVMFFHENQLTYPLPERESFDPHFGLINIVSALAADLNLFNSIFSARTIQRRIAGICQPDSGIRAAGSTGYHSPQEPGDLHGLRFQRFQERKASEKRRAGDLMEPPVGIR
ncbi:MAG: DUF3524 domain-containing protein [candidate division KSB1 bacterium]|nr:DUF3524 domain-containing protein [candidate division KSB1 bacterium]